MGDVKQMNVIVNTDELVEPLAKIMLARAYKKQKINYQSLDQYLSKVQKRSDKTGLLDIDFEEVNKLISRDVAAHTDQVITNYKTQYRTLVHWLSNKFNSLPVSAQQILEWYSSPEHKGFTKSIAQRISADINCISGNTDDLDTPVLIRNTINNELSLGARILNNKEFWFTDAGYTNFISVKGKPWHRLVHNHIHTRLSHLNFPADRLSLLPTMPRPWSTTGNKILVVESSNMHHQTLGTDHNTWRDNVTNELAKYTDRPIEYRPKSNDKKTRTSVYDLLMSTNDYYCVISDSSAAAIEAVWAGVPIITLNRHITEPVARTSIADIDNLYRGPVGDWLCALTYSQYTKKEMQNGTAWKIIEKYHA